MRSCHSPTGVDCEDGVVPAFSFDALRRFPDIEAANLVAVDATDRLILDLAARALVAAPAGTVSVIGDRYGALTLGVAAQHGATAIRTQQDRLIGERALAANAERCDLAGSYTSHGLGAEALAGARVVLLQLPTALDALDEVAGVIAAHADPDVQVFAGGRIKHMTHGMNDVLRRWFGSLTVQPARQKSRALVAATPRPVDERPTPTWPASERHEDVGLTVCAHGGVFAGTGIDIGTRFLLQCVDRMPAAATTVLDLGCGTGVLAVTLARDRPEAIVTATDESAAAVASARATTAANAVADRVTVVRDDGASTVPDASIDLVVLNPPFHVGATVHSGVARRLFADAARVLRPGGELWTVWNSHLTYRATLSALVGPTRQEARNPTFTVTVSTKP